MNKQTKDSEQYTSAQTMGYIEHEVALRVHDEKFQIIEKNLDDVKSSMRHLDGKFDSQFKWIIGMFASSIIIPVVLHFVKIV